MNSQQPAIDVSTKQMARSLWERYRQAWPWIVVGVLLAILQILTYRVLGSPIATALQIDTLLGDYSGVSGPALSVSLAVGTMLWALYAITLWPVVQRTAAWVTNLIITISINAAALYTGVSAVAVAAWFCGDQSARQLLIVIALLIVALIGANLLVASARGFAGEQPRRFIGTILLVGMFVASLSILVPRVQKYLHERSQQAPMSKPSSDHHPTHVMPSSGAQKAK